MGAIQLLRCVGKTAFYRCSEMIQRARIQNQQKSAARPRDLLRLQKWRESCLFPLALLCKYWSLGTFAALSLYLLARLRLCVEELSEHGIKFLFFYFHFKCMLPYWRGRKDSDLRNVLSHTFHRIHKSGAIDHPATVPHFPACVVS